ncbi:MAG: hypothetical protein FWF84_07360 [Kiritimatiellaeota bacterium]|nr:hypothetical protein [Kiritimatiellota bacterium]
MSLVAGNDVGASGAPTAVMPSDDEIKAMAERFAPRRPEWMPEWQWQRVGELRRIGGGSEYADAFESGEPARYHRQIRDLLQRPPRYWEGWGVQDLLLLWHQYGDALPEYVRDHMKDYWRGWLYADLPNEALTIDPQGGQKMEWYKETGDWRGLFSFFRKRWTQDVGTMNFNHTACMGALLGGAMIESEYAIQDGRSGMEKMLLRFWSFLDGTSQEMLDQYYYSITLSAQKMFSDYGPTHLDRLMGEMIRDRAVELLTSGYHPHLRRIVGAGGRTRMSNVLGFEQEGIYGVLHTLSPAGVMFHTDKHLNATQNGMHLFGYDFPPGRVALQTRAAPWAPEWSVGMVDAKPLPYWETSSESTRNNFRNPPLWRRSYLGQTYGLASQDIKGGTVDVLAQWNGGADVATDAAQLGTLTVRYNVNAPHLAKTGGGVMPYSGGIVTFQHKNRAIVCAKPRTEKDRTLAMAKEGGDAAIRKLYATVALWNFRDTNALQLYIDGKEQKTFPVQVKKDQRITLRDGKTYAAIIPLPSTALGMGECVMIEPGIPESLGDRTPNSQIAPMLMINAYNVKLDEPLAADDPRWEKICRETYGGFVLEMGDEAEYKNFAAFQKHIAAAKLTTKWNADTRLLDVTWKSGAETMEMGFSPDYPQSEVHFAIEPGQQRRAIPYRRINGEEPYLPKGIERDTTLTQQGSTGRLEKNGATLALEPGKMGYLQTVPSAGVYVGYNPFPDLTDWSFAVPGNIEVKADGKLGLARVAVQTNANALVIDYAFTDAQQGNPDRATALLVSGLGKTPTVTLNGTKVEAHPVTQDGKSVFSIPL